ncbi:MAG TPA: HAD family phosphatase [Actinomycetospora sp.]|jgi:HAD superfamily hydrolase (TIGR01509 family)|uniref:HAD family hydrolase n=1 Tax=Actinomycetospora sp. TaxID=1872135 RepID=UPI002F40E445
MSRLAAVLWDMDGTLVDSEGLWSISMAELAADLGGELSAATRDELTGSSLRNTVVTVRRELGIRDPEDEAGVARDGRWLLDRTFALFSEGLPWRPGAREALEVVREAGLRTALVTSTYRELTEVALDTLGRGFFDVTVCGDEVAATKPDPAPYLRAADLLGVEPARCVAVEDSSAGATAAEGAGATVLVVPAGVEVPPGERRTFRGTLDGLGVGELRSLLAAGVH